MRLLLTNDDGPRSRGLLALERALRDRGDHVTTVVPDRDRSGSSQAVTAATPVSVYRYSATKDAFWVASGTPVDCVKVALGGIMRDHPPDLVVSGLNLGPNLGALLPHSGTVGAAFEAARAGVPAAAISLAGPAWIDELAGVAVGLLHRLAPLLTSAPDVLYNINIPCCAPDQIKGVKLVRQGRATMASRVVEEHHAGSAAYRWALEQTRWTRPEPDDDEDDYTAVRDGWIALTPLHSDLTCTAQLLRLKTELGDTWTEG